MKKAVVGIVDTREQAVQIVEGLHKAGILAGDISVLFPDVTATKDFGYEKHSKAPEGAVAGVGTGGVIGGTLGLLAGIGALAIPGIGPFVAAGPLMAALGGMAVGATVGGITGALAGMGVPEFEAKRFEGKVKSGRYLVAVHLERMEQRSLVLAIYKDCGAHDVATAREAALPPGHESPAKRT